MHWLLIFFGIDNETARGYAFWSGIGSDLGEFAMIGLLYQMVRKHNCHVQGCLRIGRHNAGDHVVCAKHHPNGAPTANNINQAGDGNV